MDAANLPLKRIAFSLAFALLIPAAAFGQTLMPQQTSISLVGNNPQTENVMSSSTAITFNATVAYTSGDPMWMCLSNPLTQAASITQLTSLTTGGSFDVSVDDCPGQSLSPVTFNAVTHGPYNANITLTATSPSTGVTAVTIPVTYSVGSVGTGTGTSVGGITESQTAISTGTLTYGQTPTYQITLSTTSSTPITIAPQTPSVNWVTSFYSTATSITSTQSATLNITLDGLVTSAQTLTTTLLVNTSVGTISIPVTFYNGTSSGGGTVTTGVLSVSPNPISWSYSTSNPGAFPTPTVVTLSSTNGSIGYTATTSQTGWLLVNGAFSTTGIVSSTQLTISPDSNLGSLAPGSYSQIVNITGSDNSTASLTVNVTITGANSSQLTISPSSISLTAANGITTSATVTVTSSVSGTLTASVSGSTGLSVSGSGVTVVAGSPVSLTVFGNPANLTNGAYTGELTVNVGGNTSAAAITFVVGSGSSGTTTAAAPSQLYFYYEPGTSTQISQTQQIYLSGSGNFTITSSASWLSASTTSGTLPTGTVYAVVNTTGLASSTYSGYLTITNTSTNQTSQINVTLLIQGISTVYATPGDVVLDYIANTSSVIQEQAVTVASSDQSVIPVTVSVSNASSTPWLTVSGSGSTPFVTLTVIANANGLANGAYTGSISVTNSSGYNTLTIPVVLVVSGSTVSTGTGSLTLSTSAITLTPSVNGATASTTLNVSASSNTTYTVSSQGIYNGITWLGVSPSGTLTTSSNPSLVVTANPYNFPAGNYSGSITLSANGTAQTVQVTMAVGGSSSGNTITVTANGGSSTSPSLTFSAPSVGASVSPQYITVSSESGQSSTVFTISAAVTTPSGGNWLSLTTTGGTQYTTPLTVNVSVNTAGLTGGTYTGTITITPVGGTAVSVPVTLTVVGAPSIAVSTTTLSFSYQGGGAQPAAQTIPVTVTGGASASFTATATSTPSGLLVVSPASGTVSSSAATSLSVSLNQTVLSTLAAGSYTGTITVAGASGATGSATVNVTLTVTIPLPTITAVVNAASFVNGPVSPGEIITIGGTNIGPSTPAGLTLSGNYVTTTLAGVQVQINGYSAPLLYVSATQINAVVPYEIAGILNPTVIVKTNVSGSTGGQTSNGFGLTAAATAPGIFTANGSGTGPGAILNANSSVNAATNGALPGSVVQIFMTGEGQTHPQGVDGAVTPSAGPYPAPLLPITITVGGLPANYEFAGEAPGLVSGVMQLNVIIPPTLGATGNVPLVVSIGSVSSQSGVTVNIQ